jgi:hypothetical protein
MPIDSRPCPHRGKQVINKFSHEACQWLILSDCKGNDKGKMRKRVFWIFLIIEDGKEIPTADQKQSGRKKGKKEKTGL